MEVGSRDVRFTCTQLNHTNVASIAVVFGAESMGLRPPLRGQGKLPRYGGGWMHQFGHVYLLQQELLYPRSSDWFRAMELWHTAAHEGLALNVAHYTAMLRQLVGSGQWEQTLAVVHEMKVRALRQDSTSLGCALAVLTECGRANEALALVERHKPLRLSGVVKDAVMRVSAASGQAERAARLTGEPVRHALPAPTAGDEDAATEAEEGEAMLVVRTKTRPEPRRLRELM